MRKLRAWWRLARWLQPGADSEASPHGVIRRSVVITGRTGEEFEGWFYCPEGGADGSVLIAPGLHFLGPSDPRLDRFLRILAHSGLAVLCPFIPDYIDLRATPRSKTDFEDCVDVLLSQPECPQSCKPGLFSISFGSLLALHVLGQPKFANRFGGAVIFGGYCDWYETILFCLTGTVDGKPVATRDPLNQPVIFLNYIDCLPEAPANSEKLIGAWRAYMREVWGKDEFKESAAFKEAASQFVEMADPADAELFRVTTGISEGAEELFLAAHKRAGDRFEHLDPKPGLSRIECPVFLFHGRDDDVIPYTQCDRLAEELPSEAVGGSYITGVYGHTGHSGWRSMIAQGGPALREAKTMLGMIRVIVNIGRQPSG